jgi:hypothetical protein
MGFLGVGILCIDRIRMMFLKGRETLFVWFFSMTQSYKKNKLLEKKIQTSLFRRIHPTIR